LLLPLAVVYTLFGVFWQVVAAPPNVGALASPTVSFRTVGLDTVQPLALAYATLTDCAPAVFQVTVTLLLVDVPPAVIVPPEETTHV
jgi:hypothetical protein